MKTKEELNALKEEVETVSRKLHELTEEELAQVSGGAFIKLTESPQLPSFTVARPPETCASSSSVNSCRFLFTVSTSSFRAFNSSFVFMVKNSFRIVISFPNTQLIEKYYSLGRIYISYIFIRSIPKKGCCIF